MFLILRRVVFSGASVFVFLFQLIVRIVISGLNGRSLLGLAWSFFIGFLPVAIWLAIFKNAGLIPIEIRPKIHVALAFRVDRFMYDASYSLLGSLLTIIGTAAIGVLLYCILIIGRRQEPVGSPDDEEYLDVDHLSLPDDRDESTTGGSEDDIELVDMRGDTLTPESTPGSRQKSKWFESFTFVPKMSAREATESSRKVYSRIRSSVVHTKPQPNPWTLRQVLSYAPSHLMILSYFLLNVAQWMAQPINHGKDTGAWLSYVIGHFCYPLFTAIWLYVFHAPGAVRQFGFALGMQNIAGVLTHLTMPTAPPWFIHREGEDGVASYETLGYAAGLTRTNFKVGTFSAQDGFHLSPIVFGAVPSLHSAMVVLCYFFVSHYSKWMFARVLLLSAALFQWWATIYLDHHWRLDLFVGMIYACISFSIVYLNGVRDADAKFIRARLNGNFTDGSTMGMRVFRNTKLQAFFDPLL